MRALLVLLALWLCVLLAGVGVWLWVGLVGPALVLVAVGTALLLVFGVDTDQPERPRGREDRRVSGL